MQNRKADIVVGIDLGGTKILAAAVGPDGQILGRAKRSTDSGGGAGGRPGPHGGLRP